MLASMPTPQTRLAVHLALDVRGGLRVTAGGQRVLGVVEDPDARPWSLQRVDERVDRAVADPGQATGVAVHDGLGAISTLPSTVPTV